MNDFQPKDRVQWGKDKDALFGTVREVAGELVLVFWDEGGYNYLARNTLIKINADGKPVSPVQLPAARMADGLPS